MSTKPQSRTVMRCRRSLRKFEGRFSELIAAMNAGDEQAAKELHEYCRAVRRCGIDLAGWNTTSSKAGSGYLHQVIRIALPLQEITSTPNSHADAKRCSRTATPSSKLCSLPVSCLRGYRPCTPMRPMPRCCNGEAAFPRPSITKSELIAPKGNCSEPFNPLRKYAASAVRCRSTSVRTKSTSHRRR